MRVLAIDHETLFCDQLKTRLTDLCFTDFETGNSWPQALDRMAKEGRPFECLLVDIRMAPMGGIEVVLKIGSRNATVGMRLPNLRTGETIREQFIALQCQISRSRREASDLNDRNGDLIQKIAA